jgi:AcrR family transcriptional regulator
VRAERAGTSGEAQSGRAVAAVPSPRSGATRAKLIAVAERLFAEQGVQAVSLNEINKAAEQRHGSACQYHFGNKDGLIQAILDKHVPGIARQRDSLFDEMEAEGGVPPIEQVIAAFARPVAAKLLDPDGGKEFVRLNAQLVAVHTLSMARGGPAPFAAPLTDRLNRMLHLALTERSIAPHVASRRLIIASVMLYHGLADYSHVLEASGALNEAKVQMFTADLEVMMVAALMAV